MEDRKAEITMAYQALQETIEEKGFSKLKVIGHELDDFSGFYIMYRRYWKFVIDGTSNLPDTLADLKVLGMLETPLDNSLIVVFADDSGIKPRLFAHYVEDHEFNSLEAKNLVEIKPKWSGPKMDRIVYDIINR